MEFTIPDGWGRLSQEELRHMLGLYVMYEGTAAAAVLVKTAAIMYFCHITAEKRMPQGWLCSTADGRTFVLDNSLLPSLYDAVQWLDHPEDITVRIDRVGEYQAASMWLTGLAFGRYLRAENYYQTFLQTTDRQHLAGMAKALYNMPDDAEPKLTDEEALGCLLWYCAAKRHLAAIFTHFFKPAPPTGTGSMQDQRQATAIQMRLLNKGDVTKNEQIINADTYDALGELDAMAAEQEEFKRKYGK